jgi:hypothetical protein
MQGIFKKGVAASMDLADKAGRKVNDLGTKGELKIESAHLKSRVNGLMEKLGKEVYATLVEMNRATVSRDTHSIRDLLGEITKLRAQIGVKEKEYLSIGASAEAKI